MFGFDSCPDLRVWKPGEWVLLKSISYVDRNGKEFKVPQWFITDLASLPAPVRAIFNVNDETRAAAILHDFLYCSKIVCRERADKLLKEAMLSLNSSIFKANAYYVGVRAGGWHYWNKRVGLDDDDFVHADLRNANTPATIMVA